MAMGGDGDMLARSSSTLSPQPLFGPVSFHSKKYFWMLKSVGWPKTLTVLGLNRRELNARPPFQPPNSKVDDWPRMVILGARWREMGINGN